MKKNRRSKGLAVCVVLSNLMLGLSPHASSMPLTVTSFDAPGAGTGIVQGTFAQCINADGGIAGYYTDANFVNHGFVRDKHGTITTFDVPGASNVPGFNNGTVANSINESGAIAGYYTDANFANHGFVRDKHGTITTFDAPGVSFINVQGINADGTITGQYTDASGGAHGFVRDPHGTVTSFDVPGASLIPRLGTSALSINQDGAIAGLYFKDSSVGYSTLVTAHGFVQNQHGSVTSFDAPGASSTSAVSINADGAIAGYYTDGNGGTHGFVRNPHGTVTSFDAVPGPSLTFPLSINEDGTVAGYYADANGTHGFLRDKHGTITSFDALGYIYAASINANGTITGYYIDANFVSHGFVLTGR